MIPKLSLNGINYLNIGLMVISMFLAISIPFQLFLFVYAVLGPLHYMTEIGWLHQKNYFTIDKKDFVVPVILSVLVCISVLLSVLMQWEITSESMQVFYQSSLGGRIITAIDKHSVSFIFLAFTSAIFMVLINNKKLRYGLMLFMSIPAYLIVAYHIYDDMYITWFAVFLPTIIHVCIFTGLFILYGALKSRSFSGYISFAAYLLCILFLFAVVYEPKKYMISLDLFNIFEKSSFTQLNSSIWEILSPGKEVQYRLINENAVLAGKWVLKIQAFIAFSYTYHYLNWFSKTEIIKWHNVPKPWLIATVIVWLSAVGLYYYDYRMGLLALYFLSMLHVFLEFPLNVQSIIGIGKETKAIFLNPKTATTNG